MTTFKRAIAFSLIGITGLVSTGCFGGFHLTRKVLSWNDSVTETKILKTLLFYGMAIIQVYTIAVFVDFVIFNLIEFWDGTNPIAMNEGDMEERLFARKGVEYKMIATKDQLALHTLTGARAGDVEVLRFDRNNNTWYHIGEAGNTALLTVEGEDLNTMRVHLSDGTSVQYVVNDAAGDDLCQMFIPVAGSESFALKD